MNVWTGIIGERTVRVFTVCPTCKREVRPERAVAYGERVDLICPGCESRFAIQVRPL